MIESTPVHTHCCLQPSDFAALIDSVNGPAECPVKRFRLPLIGKIGVDRDRNPAAENRKGNCKARINVSLAPPGLLQVNLVDYFAQFRHE